ncbi:MAG: hypothetical protein KKH60_11745, partial [Proteobacteria bacterium]|nr:hypothetical protein [Pseudomonadota bacterium]
NSLPDGLQRAKKVMVRLKLFNVIASEKGGDILKNGCVIGSESLLRFINYRPQMFSHSLSMRCDDKPISYGEVDSLLHGSETVFLRIQEGDDSI